MKKNCTAIVLAAGRGTRMKTDTPKQFLPLNGYPVIYYSLKAFQESHVITDIVVVTDQAYINYMRQEIVEKYGISKVSAIVEGGSERYDSVYAGLVACRDRGDAPSPCDYVMIHDGARPFITGDIIRRGYDMVLEKKACIIGVPSKDTIKIVDKDNKVSFTPDRSGMWIVQTPQIFCYDLVMGAYESLQATDKSGITDDAMVVERQTGTPVYLVEGSYRNIKITTPEDLLIGQVMVTGTINFS